MGKPWYVHSPEIPSSGTDFMFVRSMRIFCSYGVCK
jgi:hypothetical protein